MRRHSTESARPVLDLRHACRRRTLATLSIVLLALGMAHSVPAANIVWTGAVDSSWENADNWAPAGVPNFDGTDTAVIGNGDTVEYPAVTLGDLNVRPGSALTISGGSTWVQSTTHWSQVNGGELTIDGGALSRTAGGNFVLGFLATTTNLVSIRNGGSLSIGGELWFGHNTNTGNQVSTLRLSNASVATSGVVGIWFWDTDAAGNSLSVDFVPGASSTISVVDRIGRRSTAGTDNVIAWEQLWNEGLLTVNGSSTGQFSDFFATTGTSAADGVEYSLVFNGVPEPSTAVFLLAGAVLLAGGRRRREVS